MKGRLFIIVNWLNSPVFSFGHIWSGKNRSSSIAAKDRLPVPNGGPLISTGDYGLRLPASIWCALLFFVAWAPAARAQQWSTLPVDALVTMNAGSPGAAITTTLGNSGTVCGGNCTVGSTVTWGNEPTSGGNPVAFTVEPNQNACSNLGAVQMTGGGTLYPAQSLNNYSAAHNDADNNTNGSLDFSGTPGSAAVISTLACVTLGPPSQDNGNDWDIFGLWGTTGNYAEAQLNPECPGAGEYGIRIEVKPTAHSSCIAIVPQGTYYLALATDFSNGYAALWVYTAGGTLVGTTSVTAGDTGGTLDFVQFGNNEGGNNSGTQTYFQNIMVNWTSASTSEPFFWTNNSLAAGVLSPERFSAWNPGVQGGIPTTRTQCTNTNCMTVTTNGAASTSAQINAAIASAPANSYVLLPAGTYTNATGCILLGVSNVTLRGAGANQTFLAPTSTSGCGGSIGMVSTANGEGSPQNGPVAVSGNVVQGATSVTLASVPNLKVGNPMILDQLDPTCDNGGIFVNGTGSGYTCTPTAPGLGGPYSEDGGGNGIRGGSGCGGSPTGCYHQQQIVEVTSCNGVTTAGTACTGTNVVVGFFPGLHMPNWSTANMFAWWATNPIQSDGVEDLSVNSANNSGANSIEIENCQGCWVKGVTSQQSSEAHVQMLYANFTTVRNNYFFFTQGASTVSYGVECLACSDSLVENNIFQAVTTPQINNGTSTGNVWGYNFTVNGYYTSANYSIPAHGDHAAGSDTNLVEGNISDGMTGDNIHGTGNMMTFFRNYYAVQPECWISGSTYVATIYGACTGGITVMQVYAFHRFYSLIGNILGTTGITTTYCNGTSSCTGGYTANNSNVLGVGYGNTVANDPNTVATITLWGNADPVTGYSSPRFNCTEVAQFPASGTATSAMYGVQFPYFNPCPSSHTLPASFYYSSKPSWWPSGKPWPIIGPDVTGGNVVGVNGLVYTNPAEDCYLNVLGGNVDGTTAVLSFNETTCYGGNSTGGGQTQPSSPSGLTATPTPVP
jgi:hypothetical protein